MGASEISIVVTVLFLLGVLVPVWIGLAAMRRGGKGGSWWTMFVGSLLTTFGWIAFAGLACLVVFQSRSMSGRSAPPGWLLALPSATMITLVSGMLLFAFGFCFHGLRIARLKQRNEELEQLSAAMTEEIHSQRRGGDA